jgi:hypothetical protein
MGSRSKSITLLSGLAAGLLLVAALCGAAQTDGPTDDAGPSMTNVDVVKMVSEHLPIEEIIRAIRAADRTAFDLDPDMLTELRRAGVPEQVIEAMTKAQQGRAMPDAAAAVAAPAVGTIELEFVKEMNESLPDGTAVSLAKDWNDRQVALSLFIYCFDPLHVPDLWQSRTPLKKFPRHHLLWFHEDTRPWRDNRKGGMVYLDLPEKTRIEASAGVHTIEFGVATRAGDLDWTRLAGSQATVEVKPGMLSRLVIQVKSRRAGRIDMAFGGTPEVVCSLVRVDPPATLKP